MTNFERIKQMSLEEFIVFLKYCDFNGVFPIIEGNRFHTEGEMIEWFNTEVQNEGI